MKQYELMFVVPGTLSEDEVKPIVASVEEILQKLGAAIVASHDLGKCRLSYPIRHIRYGYYRVCYFEAEPALIPEVQKKLSIVTTVLRVVIRAFNERRQQKKTAPVTSDVALIALREEQRREGRTEDRRFFETAPTHFPARREEKITAPAAEPAVRTTAAVELADIDKKLDEILDKDLQNV